MSDQTTNSLPTLWMRCPYDGNLCGADATLAEFSTDDIMSFPKAGWSGVLECPNGHRFRISQDEVDDG